MPETKSARTEFIVKVLERLGLPTFFLVILLGAAWQSTTWIADTVIVPISQSHLQTLKKVQEALVEQDKSLYRMSTTLDAEREFSNQRTELLKAMNREQINTTEAVKELSEIVLRKGC